MKTINEQAGAPVTLNLAQCVQLVEMFGGDAETEITLVHGAGHSGEGWYAYYDEIPEEGAEHLDPLFTIRAPKINGERSALIRSLRDVLGKSVHVDIANEAADMLEADARGTTEYAIFNTLSALNTTAPGGLHWDEYAAQEIAKAMALAPTPSARTDELALAAAGEIMGVLAASNGALLTRLKAQIQCIVQRAIDAGNQRQPLQDHQIDAITIQQWGKDRSAPLVAHRAYARAIEAAITLSS